MIDTDSRTEDADFSQYIDKQSPIKIDEFDRIDLSLQNPDSPTLPKQATSKTQQQIKIEKFDEQNKKKLSMVRDEAFVSQLKKEAIQQKKELR